MFDIQSPIVATLMIFMQLNGSGYHTDLFHTMMSHKLSFFYIENQICFRAKLFYKTSSKTYGMRFTATQNKETFIAHPSSFKVNHRGENVQNMQKVNGW